MAEPTPQKLAEWAARARARDAIVPHFWEVFPTRIIVVCGKCRHEFRRTLVPNLDEPVLVCPIQSCTARNWIPLRYERAV